MYQDLKLLEFFVFSILDDVHGLSDINATIDIYSELARTLHKLGYIETVELVLHEARKVALAAPDPNAIRDLASISNDLGMPPIPGYTELFKEKRNKWESTGGRLGNRRFRGEHVNLPHFKAISFEFIEALRTRNLKLIQQILGRPETMQLNTLSPYDVCLSDLVNGDFNAVVSLAECLRPWPEDRDAFLDDVATKYFDSRKYESAFLVLRMIANQDSKVWSLCRCLIRMLNSVQSSGEV
jgi:hypothetical protein